MSTEDIVIIAEPKGKKRSVLKTPSPSEDKLYYQISEMAEPYRSYACFLYLFGTRVSEALGIRTRRIKGYKELSSPTKNNPTRVFMIPQYLNLKPEIIKEKGLPEWESEPLRRYDIETEDDVVYVRNIPVFKVPGRPLMNKYVLAENEQRFLDILIAYINTKAPNDIIWDRSRKTMWVKIMEATGLYPHKLRSLRATKDVITYGLDIIELKRKFGWTQIKMPLLYVEMRNEDILTKMRKAVKNKPSIIMPKT